MIELLAVVAIISVLAAIAGPEYKKFTSRARQAEVKVTLGAAATAEKAFFLEAGSYTSCMAQIGIAPPAGPFFYSFGFSMVTLSSVGSVSCDINLTEGIHGFRANTAVTVPPAPGLSWHVLGAVCHPSDFKIGARGKISADASAPPDDWTLDDQGNLLNINTNL